MYFKAICKEFQIGKMIIFKYDIGNKNVCK